ncbi:MAG: L,D-transpeptidase family protein, partial [Pseudomonadota bacterium]
PLPRPLRKTLLTFGALGVMAVLAAPAPPVIASKPLVAVKAVAATKAQSDPDAYVIKRALTITEPIVHGFWAWDDAGVPDGPIIITVDTVAQTMSVFRGGYEIGVSVVLYGIGEKPTPLGVFPITQKKKQHISNLYGAPMPYMQRLTDDGVAIHASDVLEGFITHGCIGVPKEFAKRLFEETQIGDRVIITSGERLQVGGAVGAVS